MYGNDPRAPLTVAAIALLSIPLVFCSIRDHSGAAEPVSGPAGVSPTQSAAGPAESPQAGSRVVLTWRREGGFAGFCDEMSVTMSGEVRTKSCRISGGSRTARLSKEDLARLQRWAATFGLVKFETKDPGTADSMTLELTLEGSGKRQPSDNEKNEILDWAQKVYAGSPPQQ